MMLGISLFFLINSFICSNENFFALTFNNFNSLPQLMHLFLFGTVALQFSHTPNKGITAGKVAQTIASRKMPSPTPIRKSSRTVLITYLDSIGLA